MAAIDTKQGTRFSIHRVEEDAGRPAARDPGRSAGQDARCRAEGTWGAKQGEVFDAVESSEADIQDDLEFALIQMKSETLNKINDALVRLEQGDYGNCFECGEEIAEKRLRALPFAVRCKDCEEAREIAEQRERQQAARRGTSSLFLDM